MKKGVLTVNSPAYTHTVKDLSVSMAQWELEPFQPIFAYLMFHIIQELCSTFFTGT